MRLSSGMLAVTFLALSTSAQASIVAGHDYQVLATPQRQDVNGKVEVIEFFSWGCPHCYEFYPKLAHWLTTLPKDAGFRRVPVGLGHPEWEALAKAFYALQSTGDVERLDPQIFEDIHRNHVWLYDEPSITAWVGKHGVNVTRFTEAYRSFGVAASAGTAEQKAENFRLPGVPTLAVAGKYTVTGDHAAMLSTVDQLISMERAATKKNHN
ncbi:MAG TPA: thiol:disulfide interchange protein DsbA/DsbL [Steroidobacteraceae bacterium]